MAERQKTQRAIVDCGRWLAVCMRLGWTSDHLDVLQAIWWQHHDDQGNLTHGVTEGRSMARINAPCVVGQEGEQACIAGTEGCKVEHTVERFARGVDLPVAPICKQAAGCPDPAWCVRAGVCLNVPAKDGVPASQAPGWRDRLLHLASDYADAAIEQATEDKPASDMTKAWDALVAHVDGVMGTQDADADRLDWLERERADARKRGFQWNTWAYDALQSELTIREQIDKARGAAPGVKVDRHQTFCAQPPMPSPMDSESEG